MADTHTSSEFKPPVVVRHLFWCDPCGHQTRIALDDQFRCDDCGTPFERVEVLAPPQTCMTPMRYGRLEAVA